jgi:hypothetical protein
MLISVGMRGGNGKRKEVVQQKMKMVEQKESGTYVTASSTSQPTLDADAYA